ncbi:MAG: type IX secretion system membrane protein PorP/SprF, partial [Saprospiraceae bacterium]|nr:type IX secretion system membrane protein PorP/SprF [Saprospiraceae bacterium]
QYLVNPFFVNPAAAGINGLNNFHGSYRSSMNGLQNNPTTYYVSYNGMVGKKVGLGAMLLNDKVASINKYRMQLSYAYNWMASQNLKMGLGLSTEFHQINLDKNVSDNTYQQSGDPTLLNAIDGSQYFDATAGIYGVYKNKLSFGLSVPNLVRARLNKGTDQELDAFETAFQHFTATLGYRFDVKDYDFAIEPSLMVRKSYAAPVITDLNVKTYFLQNTLMAGGTCRIIDGETLMGVLLGARFGTMRVYYNYDVSFQNTQKYHSGSHEFTVNFEFAGKKKMTPEEESMKKMETIPVIPAK